MQPIKQLLALLDKTFKNFSEKHWELVTQAKDTLLNKTESAQKEYQEFRLRNPNYLVYRGPQGQTNLLAERVGRLENRKQELNIKMKELADQYARIEKAFKDGGQEKGNAEVSQSPGRSYRQQPSGGRGNALTPSANRGVQGWVKGE